MKRDMHEIFREAFKGLSLEAVRLIVGHRNSPIIQRELIRKRLNMKLMTLNAKVTNRTIIFFCFFSYTNNISSYASYFQISKTSSKN
jgi:hypothetical protein